MKTTFRQNKKGFKKTVFALFFLLVLLIIGNVESARHFFLRPIFFISRPVFNFAESAVILKEKLFTSFYEKSGLIEENNILKEKILELDAKKKYFDVLEKENQELKTFFNIAENKKYVIAPVLLRPPVMPYDVLVVDVGSDNGVKVGDTATAYGDILIGHIIEISPKTSKIKMISFLGEETNVFFDVIGLSATGIGKGGGNMEIALPVSVEIKSGERILSLGGKTLLVGIVDKTEIDPAAVFQKIIFHLPINIQELKYVMISI